MASIPGFDPIPSVLVVDDSKVQRDHAVRLCRGLGIDRVDEAGDGHEALEVLAALPVPPALMLIDLAMPRMDGIELIEAIDRRGWSVPIIVVSASGEALIETVQGMGNGVVAGLRKPLTPTALRKALIGLAPAPRTLAERRQAGRLPFDAAMLASAIEDGAVVPHFQPKVDTCTMQCLGVEALARWHHPDLGQVPPDQFIPLAEREGSITALTLAILDRSLAQCAAWNRQGLRLTMAVNLSPLLLVRPEIVGDICALAERHAVPASQVVLELTESSLVESTSPALSVLARLRLKGFGLSIDDYGTGFSSMQQLSRIPFTELKIDRSFVRGAPGRKGLSVILKSALDMARHLGLKTVAEGVETVDDLRLLQQFGCTACQGWLIARPMPGTEVARWLTTHHDRLQTLRTATEPAS